MYPTALPVMTPFSRVQYTSVCLIVSLIHTWDATGVEPQSLDGLFPCWLI